MKIKKYVICACLLINISLLAILPIVRTNTSDLEAFNNNDITITNYGVTSYNNISKKNEKMIIINISDIEITNQIINESIIFKNDYYKIFSVYVKTDNDHLITSFLDNMDYLKHLNYLKDRSDLINNIIPSINDKIIILYNNDFVICGTLLAK